MFERIRRLIASAAPTARGVVHDPVLGRLTPSESCWETQVQIGLDVVGFKIGGDVEPHPDLIAHAREIVRTFPDFSRRIAAFLAAETLAAEAVGLGPMADEIRQLELEDINLLWPTRPDDGMLYFHGPDEYRVWRCDSRGRVPVDLGFDS